MHRMNRFLIVGIAIAMIMGCATVKDVQRASELIRTDHELHSLLSDNSLSSDQKSAQLLELAHFAKKQADALAKENQESKIREAISYYRIAATAYWKSQKKDVASDLFASVEEGINLCKKLGERAPARDEMYLFLVIPQATYDEIYRDDTDIQKKLKMVNFNDLDNTDQEIELMKKVGDILIRVKKPIDGMIEAGKDERYETHDGMKKYFCDNLCNAKDNYDVLYGLYKVRVKQYHKNSSIIDKAKLPSLGEIDSSTYVIQKPQYCNQYCKK